VLAVITIIMAVLIFRARFPQSLEKPVKHLDTKKSSLTELLKYPHFISGVVAQFLYVGAQVGTWSYFIQYVQDYTGSTEKVAGYFLTGTLVAFMLGRFSATLLMKVVSPHRLMGIYGIINVFLVMTGILFPGWIGVWAIFLTSFFMSLMFPTIFAFGIKGLEEHTKIAGSIIVMAIIGGAVWTPVMGLIAEYTKSMAVAMVIPALAYAYIAWYSFSGSTIREMSNQKEK